MESVKHIHCVDCNRQMLESEVEVSYQDMEYNWLHTCIDRDDCRAHITSGPDLDVTFCPGCARKWTRHEMAVELWKHRNAEYPRRALQCCGWDYDGGYGRRPRTLNELVQGRFGRFTEQEDAVLRAVVLYLTGDVNGNSIK